MGLGDFRFGTGALGEQAEGQSFNHPYQRLGLYGALGLGLGDFRYQRLKFYGPLGLGLGDFRFGTGALGGQAASITCQQMSHCCCLPRTVTLQRTIPCTSHPEPRSNATRCPNRLPPNVTLVLRLPRNVTLQRTQSRSNATRMLQSPATKCHTGAAPATQRQSPATTCHTAAAPATQRHTATYHSLHKPPRATLQHYQDASITCHQMSHCCCVCHAPSHCNVPFPAPATQSHAPTLPDAPIACHQMSHWCCASHATSHCNVPRAAPTLRGCFTLRNAGIVLYRGSESVILTEAVPPEHLLEIFAWDYEGANRGEDLAVHDGTSLRLVEVEAEVDAAAGEADIEL